MVVQVLVLQDMLVLNQIMEYFEIDPHDYTTTIPSTYLSFLTAVLSHNTSLQELSVLIPLSDTNYEQITTFFNVISRNNKLTELKLNFILDHLCDDSYKEREQIMTALFYEQEPIIH